MSMNKKVEMEAVIFNYIWNIYFNIQDHNATR